MQKPVQRTLTVTSVLREGTSRRGDPYIEAQTAIGIVAFWGGELALRTSRQFEPRPRHFR